MFYSTDILRANLFPGNALTAANRYRVVLPNITGRPKVAGGVVPTHLPSVLDLLCTNARIPGKTVRTIERPMGAQSTRAAVGFEMGEANFTFYLTNMYMVRKYFQDWMDTVVSHRPPYEVGFFDDYKADVTVHQLDKIGVPIYSSKLIDCFPTNISEIELNNQAQTAPVEMTVTIAFKYYETSDIVSGILGAFT